MSWGERSCKAPCRCLETISMETCNVDCSGYAWDGETEPDSKPREKSTIKVVDDNVKRLKQRSLFRMLGSKPTVDKDLENIDIEKEYELIQNKKSELPAALRKKIVNKVERESNVHSKN